MLPIDPATIVQKGRLQPGRMFLIDTNLGRIVGDDEIKEALAAQQPYGEWLHAGLVHLDDLPAARLPHPAARVGGQAPAGVRVHHRGAEDPRGADGTHRGGADRIDGHGHARWRSCRTGRGCCSTTSSSSSRRSPTRRSTPSARSSSRRWAARSGPRATCCARGPRRAARWCCPTRSSPTRSWPSSSTSTTTATCPGFKPFAIDGLYPVAEGGDGLRRALDDVRAKVSDGHRGRGQDHRALGSLLVRRAGPDPVAAAHGCRPPPPDPGEDPHAGGAGRRVRRRARGAPHGAAARVRRRRHQPVPGVRDDRGPDRPGRDHRADQARRR